jgi:hypothetical protein
MSVDHSYLGGILWLVIFFRPLCPPVTHPKLLRLLTSSLLVLVTFLRCELNRRQLQKPLYYLVVMMSFAVEG